MLRGRYRPKADLASFYYRRKFLRSYRLAPGYTDAIEFPSILQFHDRHFFVSRYSSCWSRLMRFRNVSSSVLGFTCSRSAVINTPVNSVIVAA